MAKQTTSSLAQDPVIKRLNLQDSFPSVHILESTSIVQTVHRNYLNIIRKLIGHINELETEDELHAIRTLERHQLVSVFKNISDNGDVEFRVQGIVLKTHSAIASAWSKPLATMLQSPMREGLTKHIEIHNEDPDIVRMILKYFYKASLDLTLDNALPLLKLGGSLYEVAGIRDKCCEYLLQNTNLENCLEIFTICWQHEYEVNPSWKNLSQATSKFIIRHAKEIVQHCSGDLTAFEVAPLFKIWPLLCKNLCTYKLTDLLVEWAQCHLTITDLSTCLVFFVKALDERHPSDKKAAYGYFAEFCTQGIINDFNRHWDEPGFATIEPDFLIKILRSDKLYIGNEEIVFKSVIAWLGAKEGREIHLPQILECIRFPYIESSTLVKIPTSYPKVGECKNFESLLEEALHFQMSPTSKDRALTSSPRTKQRKHERFHVPQLDAKQFSSYVSSAVLKLTKNSENNKVETPEKHSEKRKEREGEEHAGSAREETKIPKKDSEHIPENNKVETPEKHSEKQKEREGEEHAGSAREETKIPKKDSEHIPEGKVEPPEKREGEEPADSTTEETKIPKKDSAHIPAENGS